MCYFVTLFWLGIVSKLSLLSPCTTLMLECCRSQITQTIKQSIITQTIKQSNNQAIFAILYSQKVEN